MKLNWKILNDLKVGKVLYIKDHNSKKQRPHLIIVKNVSHRIFHIQGLTSQSKYNGKNTYILENLNIEKDRKSYTSVDYYKTLSFREICYLMNRNIITLRATSVTTDIVNLLLPKIRLINSEHHNEIINLRIENKKYKKFIMTENLIDKFNKP